MFVCFVVFYFFFSSRRRHTRCALVTGVQTCALPICLLIADELYDLRAEVDELRAEAERHIAELETRLAGRLEALAVRLENVAEDIEAHSIGSWSCAVRQVYDPGADIDSLGSCHCQIGRASCRERVCQSV